ncbi:MAG: N-acetyltransferase [Alphaproteobacteria bacterium]|nr:N-acetyltransferase [Alphaproteobacteria bacterium]
MTANVRDADVRDLPALHAIYSHHVLHGFGTFDEVPPSLTAFEEKWRAVVDAGLPWLVAEGEGEVLGYAYASIFRPRTGYRYTIEDSVYIRDDQRGHGLGTALLRPLISRCEATGARQVVAVIGDSKNTGSIALHRKAGFREAGTLASVGYKFGRWVDIVFMQRTLNGGDAVPPTGPGAWRSA